MNDTSKEKEENYESKKKKIISDRSCGGYEYVTYSRMWF